MKGHRCVVLLFLAVLYVIAQQPAKVDYTPQPKLVGDEIIGNVPCVPYLGSRQSPGDQIGTTAYDMQANCTFGARIMVDDAFQASIDWMYSDYPGMSQRFCMWNMRMSNGSYYGATQVSPSWSGYVQLDIIRDVNPDSQRTVICYHYSDGSGLISWIRILPDDPKPLGVTDHIWPYICCTASGNIVVATGDFNYSEHHVYLTTDQGTTWSIIADFDSCATLSQFLRASHISNRAAFVHTQYISDSISGGQLDNDVYYTLSTDGGMTWGVHTNITNYQPYPGDSVRAYCNVNAAFDANDYLHIVWAGRRMDVSGYYEASKIFHWDEVHDTITVVSSPSAYYNDPGGWWIAAASGGQPGAWRMPCDQPQLVVDPTDNVLYCLWHGNDDYNDSSTGGFFNGEIYGSYSTDDGLTWSNYVNLTNTRSPGSPPGECHDEDYGTAHPWVVNDSIFITYIEDKDAGSYLNGEGSLTENPVRCWVFPTSLITGIEESQAEKSSTLSLQVVPNPFRKELKIQYALSSKHYAEGVNGLRQKDIELRIHDACGRVVKSITQLPNYPITWYGDDQYGTPVPAGVYFVTLRSGDQSISTKVVKLE